MLAQKVRVDYVTKTNPGRLILSQKPTLFPKSRIFSRFPDKK